MNDERAWRRGGSGVEGNVRTAAIWTQVRALSESRQRELSRPLRVLDLGGGTGGLAVALAEQGHTVTVVDPSPDALASMSRRVAESPAAERITAVQGDADTLAGIAPPGTVDLLSCHGTLEYVDDPEATLARIAEVLAPGGHLSLVTAQRVAAVISRALAGRFDQATTALTSPDGRWGEEDPVPRREPQQRRLRHVGVPLVRRVERAAEQADAQPVPGRQVAHVLPGGALLIDDSYNANPGSVAAAIDALAASGDEAWLVLGDMRELGPEAEALQG